MGNEVFSAGLKKTYTLYWILLHEVIIAEGQIWDGSPFHNILSFPVLLRTCQIQQKSFHWC